MRPAEIGVNTLSVSKYDAIDSDERPKAELDLIEEIRYEAQVRAGPRRQQVTNYYNSEVKRMTFNVGDLVLRNCNACHWSVEHEKLSPTWEGPYIVTEVIGHGAYRLRDRGGKPFPNSWNAQHLTKYYQ